MLIDIKMADIYREIDRGDYSLDDLARRHGHAVDPWKRPDASCTPVGH
jgi:hypothetical protein